MSKSPKNNFSADAKTIHDAINWKMGELYDQNQNPDCEHPNARPTEIRKTRTKLELSFTGNNGLPTDEAIDLLKEYKEAQTKVDAEQTTCSPDPIDKSQRR